MRATRPVPAPPARALLPVMRHLPLLVLVATIPVAAAVLIAFVVAGTGDDVPDRPTTTSVDAIVDATPRFLREPVRVSGTAVPIDGERFVLRGGGDSIVVRPEPTAVEGAIRPGDAVTVFGIVEVFDRLQAAELRRLLDSGTHPVLATAPTQLEDPFVSADRVET